MISLPGWMRIALLATAAMNLAGSAAFLPRAGVLRSIGKLPEPGHPLYISTVGLFIFLFGLAYLYCGVVGKAERIFIAIGAAGKFGFFLLLAGFYLSGDLPFAAPLSGSGDFVFASIFAYWLFAGDNRSVAKH